MTYVPFPSLMMFIGAIVQAIVLMALAPLFSGISRMIRARMHSRRGPGVLQDYRDIFKLLRRQNVGPSQAGRVFRIMPFVLLGSMLLVAMTLPIFTQSTFFGPAADIITLIYLFAVFRFFFSLSGLDSGSSFAGIGASRELVLGVLIEPTIILALIVVALITGTTNVGSISTALSQHWVSPLATVLALAAFAFATFVEMGKLPFDVAEAEQELQEGPLTEYSGSSFALVKWGLSLKQVVVAELFLSIFVPFGRIDGHITVAAIVIAIVCFIVKLIIAFIIASVIENSLARGRFLLSSRVTWLGFSVAALAFVFYLTAL